jgi:hypothetical protein
MVLPWLQISYSTGNHLERVRPTFAFIDGNANNRLEFTELSNFFSDLNQVFFGQYFRNDAELIRAVLADSSSPCLATAVSELQGKCAVGDRAACLQPANVAGNPMRDPVKLQDCIASLMDSQYITRTGDDCVRKELKEDWFRLESTSASATCVRRTSISIEDFSVYGRHMVLGLPQSEKRMANHCINASFTTLLSIYGVITAVITVDIARDMDSPRCHSILKPLKDRKIEPITQFLCVTTVDFWTGRGSDLGNAVDPLKPAQPPQCRQLAAWIDQVFELNAVDFGCNVTCSPGGRAQLSDSCVPLESVGKRLNRQMNSPFRPTCSTRIGSGVVGDACPRFTTCPSCSLPVNSSAVLADTTPREHVHPGTSGMSAVYDTMCVIGESIFIRDLRRLTAAERVRDALAREQGKYFQARMTAQCETKIAAGEFANGIVTVAEATAGMSAWPDDNNGRKLDKLTCECRVNGKCSTCISECVDSAFKLPAARTAYRSEISCNRSDLNEMTRLEGAGAFKPPNASDPYALPPSPELAPYDKSNPLRWQSVGAECVRAPGAVSTLQREFKYTGSVREYASPLPILGQLCVCV